MSVNTTQMLGSIGLSKKFLEIDNTAHYTSIFIHDPEKAPRLQGFCDSVAKAHGEELIASLDLKELQRDGQWTIVITNKALYKFEKGASLRQPRKRNDLISYFSVEPDLSDPRCFFARMYKDSLKTSVRSTFMKIVGSTGAKVDMSNILQIRQYICESELQRDQFVWAMNRLITLRWQGMLEKDVIPSPEMYQHHHFVIKQNRRGVGQERLLVASNEWLYNVELKHNPMGVEDMKWCVPISCIHAVSLEIDCQLNFYFERDTLKAYIQQAKSNGKRPKPEMIDKPTDSYLFTFIDDKSRAAFVTVLRYLYSKLTNNEQLRVVINTQQHIPTAKSSFLHDSSKDDLSTDGTQTTTTGGLDSSGESSYRLTRKNSSLESLNRNRISNVGDTMSNDSALIVEQLDKFVKGSSSKSHPKTFALYPDLTIKWGDSSAKYKYQAKIISVMKAQDVLDQLPPDRKGAFFALRTTEKPLYLIASNADSAASWRSTIESLSSQHASLGAVALDTSAGKQDNDNINIMMDGTIPQINGYLNKFVHNGRSSHVKYFALYFDGTIKWGDNPQSLKYTAQIIEVNQDISEITISHHEAAKFVRILTTDKTLELICPNQESADRWVRVANKVLGFDDDDDDNNNDYDM